MDGLIVLVLVKIQVSNIMVAAVSFFKFEEFLRSLFSSDEINHVLTDNEVVKKSQYAIHYLSEFLYFIFIL